MPNIRPATLEKGSTTVYLSGEGKSFLILALSKNDPNWTWSRPTPKVIAFFGNLKSVGGSYVPGGGDCDLLARLALLP